MGAGCISPAQYKYSYVLINVYYYLILSNQIMRLIVLLSILFFSCGQNPIDYKIIIDSNDQILTKNSNIKLSLSEVINESESSVNFFLKFKF